MTGRERHGARARLRASAIVVAWVGVSAIAGCAGSRPAAQAAPPVAATYSIPVRIQSRFREDLNVFVQHDGIVSRLSRVSSVSNAQLTIPPHMVGTLGEVTLIGEGIGGRDGSSRVTTGRMRVLPGQAIVWTIETRLPSSFAQVVPVESVVADSIKPN
jgi:hypothetical protein